MQFDAVARSVRPFSRSTASARYNGVYGGSERLFHGANIAGGIGQRIAACWPAVSRRKGGFPAFKAKESWMEVTKRKYW